MSTGMFLEKGSRLGLENGDTPTLEEVYDEFLNGCGHFDTIDQERRLEGVSAKAPEIDASLRVKSLDLHGRRLHARSPDQSIREEEFSTDENSCVHVHGPECLHIHTRRCLINVTPDDLAGVSPSSFKIVERRRGAVTEELVVRMKHETAFALGFI